MSRIGLNTRPHHPRLPARSSSSLLEIITKKTIDQISDLNFVAAHLAGFDEGVDDFRYPERSFFAFPQPLSTLHSRTRTIRRTMVAANESGLEKDQVRGIHGPCNDAAILTRISNMAQFSLCPAPSLPPRT